jgi:hypothetical protein
MSTSVHPLPPESSLPTQFPISWMLKNGSPVAAYRSLLEVARFASPAPNRFSAVPYSSRMGWHLLMMQDSDGRWPGGWLTIPETGSLSGIGTIPAYRKLVELGWDPESPGLACTKRLLFRLLAEDDDPSLLAELMPAQHDAELIRRGRLILREAAAAALAVAGYEGDPRLRGAARRLIDRVGAYLRSPLSQKPWIRLGNQHVLPPEVHAPSFHTLLMLAHMPLFRTEHHDTIERLYHYLAQAWPRQHAIQQVGSHLIDQPHLVLGDLLPTRNAMDADMPSSLLWLEIMARMGYLRRNENWLRLFERLLDDRDRHGVWHPPRSVVMPKSIPSWSWAVLPLSDDGDPEKALSVDVSFRLGLIARIAGRQIDLV